MHQCPVPPQVIAKIVGGVPVGLQPSNPIDTFTMAILHLHDMGDGMNGPGINNIDIYGGASRFLRRRVIAGLFQGKRPHAKDKSVPWNAFIPGADYAFNRTEHVTGRTQVKIGVMRQTHRQ